MTRIETRAPVLPPQSAASTPQVAQATEPGDPGDRAEKHPGVNDVREAVHDRLPQLDLGPLDLGDLDGAFQTPLATHLSGARDRIERSFGERLSPRQHKLLKTLEERTSHLEGAEFAEARAAYAKKLDTPVDDTVVAFVDEDRIVTSKDDAHTLTHEAVHLVGDEDFSKFFGAEISEGVTEYLALRALRGDAEGQSSISKAFEKAQLYPDEVRTIEGAVKRGYVSDDLLERAYLSDDQVARAQLFVGLERAGVKIDSEMAKEPGMIDLVRTLGK
ncbi:MAG: hypothetical protein RIT81_23930 [Deltaproteobacteria bacterium]